MFDGSFVKHSIVGKEGLNPHLVDDGVLEFDLVDKGREQSVCVDMMDRRIEGNGYWVPLYFVDNEDNYKLELVLRFSAFNTEVQIKPGLPLPYEAIARPTRDRLTLSTWFDNRTEIRKQQAIRAGVAVTATVVATGFIAIRRRAKKKG